MKVGFFTDGYLPQLDGVGINLSTLVEALRRAGQEVYVVAPKHPGFKDKDPHVYRLRSVSVHKKPEWRMAFPFPEKDLQKASKIPFDIVHGHAGGPVSFLGFEIARRKNLPYVFTYHTLWNRYTHYILKGKVLTPKIMEVATKIYCNLCTVVIAPTRRVKKELERYGVTKPIHVIPGRLELSRFRNVERGFLRKRLHLPKETKIILYVGRLGKEKNVDLIIKSFSLVARNEKNARLVFVGDGPEREKLEKLAKKEGVGDKTLFTGFIDKADIPSVYADGDVFVFASQTETQGLVVPEALASGLPSVVVDDPAFEEVVIDGYNGLLASDQPDDFSSKVTQLLDNQNLRTKLSENAKKFAIENFSIEQQVEEHLETYKKALELHKKRKTRADVLKKRLSDVRNFLKLNARLATFKQVLTKEIKTSL
jgi:glycosyltransferase involved in cell wall biosynthesis